MAVSFDDAKEELAPPCKSTARLELLIQFLMYHKSCLFARPYVVVVNVDSVGVVHACPLDSL